MVEVGTLLKSTCRFHHGVLGVGLWASYLPLMVAAGRDHASQQSIVDTLNSLPHEVEFAVPSRHYVDREGSHVHD
jgi:hypothetical protein